MSRRSRKKKSPARRLYNFLKVQIFLLLIIVAAVAYYYAGGYAQKVSDLKAEAEELVQNSTANTFRQTETSIVYAAGGEVIQELKGEKDVYYVDYEDIPIYVNQALISIEDKKFYKHKGVDYKAILRAFYYFVKEKKITQGGSTITQQLARTIFLSNEKTWQRKLEEIYVAINLEQKYSKEDILEFYLNNVYFANGYYGIQAASRGYFSKDVDELSLSEICFLIAIPNSPNLYDPVTNMENTYTRRDIILKEMYEDGVISGGTFNKAASEIITLKRPNSKKNDYVETYAYHCATKVLMELEGFEFRSSFRTNREKEDYEEAYEESYSRCNLTLFTGGYRIYTSIDLIMQRKLQATIDDCLAEFTDVSEEGVYDLQSAAVCIDNETGQVKAIVGGRSQNLKGYTLNRAYQSYRQPGSSIKPLIVYTPAIEDGYTPDSIVVDEEIEDGPENASGNYSGEITLRQAVMYSKNTIAWKLFEEITPERGLQYLKDMGFSKIVDADYGMASALGGLTYGVSTLEMAKGYGTIENDGFMRDPGCIVSITDTQGNVIYEAEQNSTAIYKENAARTMTNMLKSVITDGTAKGINLGDMPCAGKTGTTNNNRDGWFVGYTPYYTTSVWVGYDIPKKLPGLQGSSYPATIWQLFMKDIHEGLPIKEFKEPVSGITDEENLELEEEEGIIEENLDDYVPETRTITFEGTNIPDGVIPEDATNVTITTRTVVEQIPED